VAGTVIFKYLGITMPTFRIAASFVPRLKADWFWDFIARTREELAERFLAPQKCETRL